MMHDSINWQLYDTLFNTNDALTKETLELFVYIARKCCD
jgi:hypothetical protein